MKKRYALLTTVLCLSMAVFTGCGSGDSNTDSQVTESPAADATDDSVMDDVKDGAEDVLDGAEDAVGDTVDGARDAVDDAENAMDGDDSDTNNSVTNGDSN